MHFKEQSLRFGHKSGEPGNGNKVAVVMQSGNPNICRQTLKNLVAVAAVLVLFLLLKLPIKKLLNIDQFII